MSEAASTLQFPVPEIIAGDALAWLDGGRPEGPAARSASTVMLLRDGSHGIPGSPQAPSGCPQVFMLRRVSSMAFAPSMWVFPGGGVDPRDAEVELPWAGPSPSDWGDLMEVAPDIAQKFVIAAAREVFEECGVLLAGSDANSAVADVAGEEWRRERDALLSKEQSFAQLLARRGLVLRSDLLTVRDHWITPECEPRRYDTWFFAARLPDGQHPDDDTSEADRGGWVDANHLLQEADSGAAQLLPPTVVQLRTLGRASEVDAVMGHRSHILPAMPVPMKADGGLVMQVTVTGD